MSRDYINPDEVPGDVAASLRRIADDLNDLIDLVLVALVDRTKRRDAVETLGRIVQRRKDRGA